jgi:hypothetical protein
MQLIQITVFGARTYLSTATGMVGGVTDRQAQRRSPTGAARGPILNVREFWVKDSESGEKLEARAVPPDFAVRNGQQATLIFHHLGKKNQRLLAARNNSSGDYLLLPPPRSLTLALVLWVVLGWLAFWITQLTLSFDHKPGLVLFVLTVWLVAGIWYFLHARAFRNRLQAAVAAGPAQLALMVDH